MPKYTHTMHIHLILKVVIQSIPKQKYRSSVPFFATIPYDLNSSTYIVGRVDLGIVIAKRLDLRSMSFLLQSSVNYDPLVRELSS